MLLPNPAIDEQALAALVAERYGAAPSRLQFAPVGGDGWHYSCGPFWVSVRRDRQGHRPEAYAAAAELVASGLDFVLAPLADDAGRVVHYVGPFPAVVLPFVAGATLFESGLQPGDVESVVAMCERLHAARCTTDLSMERFELPFADELQAGLADAVSAGSHLGPYGAPLRELVARNRDTIEGLVAEVGAIVAACRADPTPFVLTHGEPNRGNVLRGTDGRLHLIDWGDLAYGPPERDWASLADFNHAYPMRPAFARFYQSRWDLGEIAEYVSRFTAPHSGSIEDDDKWQELRLYLH